MKKLTEYKTEDSTQLKINSICEMLEKRKEEIEKTKSAKKTKEFHKKYILRFKTDDKRQTLIQLDYEELIKDNNFNFNPSVAYSIFMHHCFKNNLEEGLRILQIT